MNKYPLLAKKHKDWDGYFPKHTWFYLYSGQNDRDNIASMSQLCANGFGELELHLHHGRGYLNQNLQFNVFQDVEDSEALRNLIKRAISDFNQCGALITSDEKITFGVIHGAWALDNSRNMRHSYGWCGVNDEITVLKEMGCYADFTFPAWGTMQPAMVNTIYYARDDPIKPKSYNLGIPMVTGKIRDDFVIFMGPAMGITDIGQKNPPNPSRMLYWIESSVCVVGQPQWIFVKVDSHGCHPGNKEVILGEQMDSFFNHIETKYNDGKHYRLHYVTAREAFNIAKAAEAGMKGNPNEFRNFIIKPYKNSLSRKSKS
ncbi:MAG: hypothetical protein ACMUIP_03205 [bacterium]